MAPSHRMGFAAWQELGTRIQPLTKKSSQEGTRLVKSKVLAPIPRVFIDTRVGAVRREVALFPLTPAPGFYERF